MRYPPQYPYQVNAMDPEFHPLSEPLPLWVGPYTPRRGFSDGYSVTSDGLVLKPWSSSRREIWVAESTFALRVLLSFVDRVFQGGHVKILPGGYVVKPLRKDETGTRNYLGQFLGPIWFIGPERRIFNPWDPGELSPGDPWPFPCYGLEATLNATTGRLVTKTPFPKRGEEHTIEIVSRDRQLASGFSAARPGVGAGRVRILESGVVLTKRQDRFGEWHDLYVGRMDLKDFRFQDSWIERGHRDASEVADSCDIF